jgi:TP901-1 family phage major tail protein
MAIYSGTLLLLKIANDPGDFITIGGMRSTKISINNQLIDCSNKLSGRWRQLLEHAGMMTASISGAGVFTDSEAEQLVQQIVFSGQIKNYQLCFGNGKILLGHFFISNYERTGNYAEEETYAISLESSGALQWI